MFKFKTKQKKYRTEKQLLYLIHMLLQPNLDTCYHLNQCRQIEKIQMFLNSWFLQYLQKISLVNIFLVAHLMNHDKCKLHRDHSDHRMEHQRQNHRIHLSLCHLKTLKLIQNVPESLHRLESIEFEIYSITDIYLRNLNFMPKFFGLVHFLIQNYIRIYLDI